MPWLEWSREDRDDSGYKWRSIAELATERFAVHREIWLEIHINSYIHDVIMLLIAVSLLDRKTFAVVTFKIIRP